MGHDFKSKLVFIDTPVNSKVYTETIIQNSGFIDDAMTAFPQGFLLQHDNARPHVSKCTQNFLSSIGITVLKNWPPYSPDLNIIEVIWAKMKKRVQSASPASVEQLKKVIIDVWQELSIETINKLVQSIPRRLEYVAANDGLTCVGKI